MALKIHQKKNIVAELAQMSSCVSVIAADYRGLTVSEMTKLRMNARKQGITVKVVQNNLACRAFADTALSSLEKILVGPIILIASKEDPGEGARLAQSFAKEHEKFQVKGLVVGDEFLEANRLKEVASLPTKEQAISTLLSVMIAPMNQFVRTLSESYGQFVRVVSRASEKQ